MRAAYSLVVRCWNGPGGGVAVANAHPDVIEVANEVTQSNDDDDGVAVALERLVPSRPSHLSRKQPPAQLRVLGQRAARLDPRSLTPRTRTITRVSLEQELRELMERVAETDQDLA